MNSDQQPRTTAGIDTDAYRDILHALTAGFAVWEVVPGAEGKAEDLILRDANAEFARILGKAGQDITGQSISKILPGLHTWEFDWVKALARVAATHETDTIEEYAEGSVRKWLSMLAVNPRPGIVAVIVNDVTEELRMRNALSLERGNVSY